MALRVKQHVLFNSGWTATASSGILAGMVVALRNSSGSAVLAAAVRGTDGYGDVVGLAGDDATNSGNTIAIVDPVDQAFYMRPARRLGDYLDETITNRTNWTDSGTAKRGITVYSGPAGEFATDQYVTTLSASAASTDAGAAPSYAIGDGWTYAVTANAGHLIDDGGTASIVVLAYLTEQGGAVNSLLAIRWDPVLNGGTL